MDSADLLEFLGRVYLLKYRNRFPTTESGRTPSQNRSPLFISERKIKQCQFK